MKIINPECWDEEHHCCTEHGVLTLPYPQCLATKHHGVQVQVSEADWDIVHAERLDPDNHDKDFGIKDLLPANHADWLFDRIVCY